MKCEPVGCVYPFDMWGSELVWEVVAGSLSRADVLSLSARVAKDGKM